MQWQQLVTDIYERISQELEHADDGDLPPVVIPLVKSQPH